MPRNFRRKYKKKTATKVSKPVKKYVSSKVKTLIDKAIEDKHHDIRGSMAVTWNGGVPQLIRLTDIAQGVGDGQRIGDAIRVKEIQIKYAAVTSATIEHIRIIIFQWRSFQYPIAGVNVLQIFNQPWTPESAYRFDDMKGKLLNVIYDKRHPISTNDFSTQLGYAKLDMGFTRNIQYQPATNTEMKNSLWMYAVSSQDNTIFPLPALLYDIRVMYEDA